MIEKLDAVPKKNLDNKDCQLLNMRSFEKMVINLGDDYHICAIQETNDIAVNIYHNQNRIGEARLTTDHIDSACITHIAIDNEHIHYKFNQKYTLVDILLKLLMKFPTIVRKPEFRFILNVPENMESQVLKHNFDNGSGLEKEILIRKESILPVHCECPKDIIFQRSIDSNEFPGLLTLLKKNAYWQKHLTLERLKLLVNNSQCFFANKNNGELIGFSRVLTNNTTFASLWDVVVDESYRGSGIGTALMYQIFSDPNLKTIPNWLLFTDTAKKLYEKFGFVSEGEIPNRKLVHKLRLQESHPTYMNELIHVITTGLPIQLNEKQTFDFLFGDTGKRAKLSDFWKNVPCIEEISIESGKNNLKSNFS